MESSITSPSILFSSLSSWLSLQSFLPFSREHVDERVEMLRARGERADAVGAHGVDDGVVEGGRDADSAPFAGDVAVQVLDLGAAPADHVLEHRRAPAGEEARGGRDVALDVGAPAAGDGVDEALRRHAVDGLDLVS